jgi:hypothetical protein
LNHTHTVLSGELGSACYPAEALPMNGFSKLGQCYTPAETWTREEFQDAGLQREIAAR